MDWLLYYNGLRHERVKNVDMKWLRILQSNFKDELHLIFYATPIFYQSVMNNPYLISITIV